MVVDEVEAEMVADADVGDHGNVATVEAESPCSIAATRSFPARRASTSGRRTIRAAWGQSVAGVDALTRSIARPSVPVKPTPGLTESRSGDQANGGRLAVWCR